MSKSTLDAIRQSDGTLPAYAWPGAYPMFYLDRAGQVLCPVCASREVDPSQEPVAADINYEDPALHCEDCGRRIPSAYAEDEVPQEVKDAEIAEQERAADAGPGRVDPLGTGDGYDG